MTIYLARSPFSLVLVTLILCSNRFLLRTQTLNRPSPKRSSSRYMGDHSSATVFEVGDSVTVVEDVMKAGRNLRGLSGEVIETWEKCDVDPTCCCAEWVDDGLSVHVKFNIPYESDEGDRKALIANEVFIHYFAESELVKAESLGQGQSKIGDENSAPFDGLSCKAFKLDKLKMGEQAQRIAAFVESREKS